jgi:hypothetical protein
MEADRIVEKPGNGEDKKKGRFGFFGRKKSDQVTNNRPLSVSRPPSTIPVPHVKPNGANTEEQDIDEDLPPRIDSPQQTKNLHDPADDSPAISVHAGFDFQAISEVLTDARNNTDIATQSTEPRDPATSNGFESLPTVQRPESAPLPTQVHSRTLSLDDSSDLEDTFARKATLSSEQSPLSQAGEEGDLGDVRSHAVKRPPPAPSILLSGVDGGFTAGTWSTPMDQGRIYSPDPPSPQGPRIDLGHDADEGDITAGAGWSVPLDTPKTAVFNNPWDT